MHWTDVEHTTQPKDPPPRECQRTTSCETSEIQNTRVYVISLKLAAIIKSHPINAYYSVIGD